MTAPRPSRRLVYSPPATLLLRLLLLAGAADAAPPLLGVSPQGEPTYSVSVIACRDGSGYFPRNRLNDGYCDCADGTDEPDCCDGSDEYESGINCQNTCRNINNLDVSNVLTNKHTIDIEDLIQKLRGIACIIMTYLVVGLMVTEFHAVVVVS
ncbi:hypothetical protein PR202_gb04735 [Eleusine coracana subsp. coracana]|uniref:Glucosidase II beta subunit N-terminal domain-containing protein n=1 Tax=Eleusine coracana subsp. coracana TaxID=191504 RepID=A0AAV5E648_ELECO|nr:hypothetical protein PR202_gb04735 [Eleusine coracana subsp. coracana]